MVKNLPADAGSIPRLRRPPLKEMATHSRILYWEIPGTEKTGGPWSIGLQRVGLDTNRFYHTKVSARNLCCFHHLFSWSLPFSLQGPCQKYNRGSLGQEQHLGCTGLSRSALLPIFSFPLDSPSGSSHDAPTVSCAG